MTTKGKILVVDDDRLVLATVTHGLAQAGYEVIDADNGDDAILLARKHRPELALLDIRMEGKSGFDVAEYLRDFCHIPFMFLSAFADPDTVAKVAELGAVAYMVKPLDVGQIVPTVDAAFEQLRAQRAKADAQREALAAQPPQRQADVVSLAAGVLMHRYSLSRGDALARLARIADAASVPLAEQAERLVSAVEELARPGSA
ncbi:MAG: response regulator receiver protein CheY-like [Proteobacteria bacterium]|jgi:two-component system, response regulator PdtaR|nr:response regulator receiver protein CheY-like [Pseudomonadota bacterium]